MVEATIIRETEPPKPDFWQLYMKWLNKNWMLMVGIIIIMGLVLYDMATVQTQKADVAKACNDYWIKQSVMVCPALQHFSFDANSINLTVKS